MSKSSLRRYLLKDQIKPGSHIAVFDFKTKSPCFIHWHNYIELELVTGGYGNEVLNGHSFELKRGSLSLLRLTDFHEVIPSDSLSIMKLIIDDSLLSEDLLSELTKRGTLFCQLDDTETKTLEQLLTLCLDESNVDNINQRYLKHLLVCILLRVLEKMPATKATSTVGERPIQAAILYIHMHFRENPSLKEVAKIAHYNASHFSATFHKELGMTYSEYVNMLKVDYAKELLVSTKLKISEICFECGVASHSNFLRLFHKFTGLSPIQYKKKYSQNAEKSNE